MPSQDPRGYQYVHLTDFTPGIYSKTRAYSANATPAPQGAAQVTNTYRCIALPEGGLAPGPRKVTDWDIFKSGTPTSWDTAINTSFNYRISGFGVFGPATSTGLLTPTVSYPEEFLVATEWIRASDSKKRLGLVRMSPYLGASYAVDPITGFPTTTTGSSSSVVGWGSSMGTTRAATADATGTAAGAPFMIFDYWDQDVAADAKVYNYPQAATPTALAVDTLITGKPGTSVLHQGRVLLLWDQDWPGPSINRRLNDQMVFTDPANTLTVSSTPSGGQTFSNEDPTGYGAVGSISLDSLLLVKVRGGAVLVTGAIPAASAIALPGVMSTGDNFTKAATTSHGLFYIGSDDGMWVWRGADSSQKISLQLEDGSFRLTNTTDTSTAQSGIGFHVADWGDWIVCSNDWLYDVITGGWWRIDNTAQDATNTPLKTPIWAWGRSYRGNTMHGAELSYSPTYTTPLHTWDRDLAAFNFSWQSHPIHVSVTKAIDVMECEFLIQGTGNVTVTFTGHSGAQSQPVSYSVNSTAQPKAIRKKIGFGGQYISARIVSDGGTGPAPVVHRVSIGYTERMLAGEN